MAQHVGQGLDVHPILQGDGRERMPLWHNKDKSENPLFARGWRFVLILFPLKTAPKMGVRKGGDKAGLHIKDKFLEAALRLTNNQAWGGFLLFPKNSYR